MPIHERYHPVIHGFVVCGVIAAVATAVTFSCSTSARQHELPVIDFTLPRPDYALQRGVRVAWAASNGKLYAPATTMMASAPLNQPQHQPVKFSDVGQMPPDYVPLLDAFGRLKDPSGHPQCTVTHVGNGTMLTAGHCFSAPAKPSAACGEGQRSCAGYTATFGYYADVDRSYVYPCECVALAQNTSDGDDYAKFVVAGYATMHQLPVVPRSGHDPARGDPLVMFEYLDVGGPLVFSWGCEVEGQLSGTAWFEHDCYVSNGASGAAVLLQAGFGVAGVHHGTCQSLGCATPESQVP